MRSRTIREGSVGLLILVGLSAFVGLVLWIRGFKWGTRTYQFTVTFADVAGMKVGAGVRYRGVDVGKITEIQATTNGVDATIQLDAPNLVIPRNVKIEANQSGLIGETSIDITPPENLPSGIQGVNPHSSQCDTKLVICHKNRVNGEIGVSFIELLRNTDKLTKVYTDPAFFDNVNSLTKNASLAASGVAKLTAELSLLTRSVRQQVGTFSTATNTVTVAAAQTANRIGNTADKFGNTAEEFGKLAQSSNELLTSNQANLNNTLQQFSKLATSANQVLTKNQDNLNTLLTEFTKLAVSTNELVATNRGTLQKTLTNISQSSEQLTILVTRLANTTEKVDVAKIVGNLETLSANAAEASANLRDVTAAVNNPTNFLVLQQTLDSARATFENVQKITADLDELTGDSQFRQNVKDLVNGLSKLVSSTEQLQEQIQVAQQLETVNSALKEATSQATDSIIHTQSSPTIPHKN
ncbi:MAG TPA: MCE family protein [Cyanobacteria bacterium UBA11149]|nr:MCE family protein [Cyanobacteria bacterium UBA11367]HBE59477.1 MCE family protein [Cyanobacteria bacterium UBA11366]HBK65567.1 MCE family protein [Cyanobacteria bacterium UBA11166]HBR75164.1 MCE family protein [Cyanobacteria bacterium UBA11159]HBS68738.1 MCE family protein [Cyanobacteria bacterium UBA11153]HBW90606.1 MCE family protein [Cyanobacteria bacterium UBA11149]HCA97555.1 MCE family protein [Cyanobacteria bacterium UBA9226]